MNNITGTYVQHAKQHSMRPAIIIEDQQISYAEWAWNVQRIAMAFLLEASKNKRVVLFLPNGHLFLELFAGASAAGWASVVGDMRWTQKEIDERLNIVSPDIVIADERMSNRMTFDCEKVIYTDEISQWITNKSRNSNSLIVVRENVPFYIGFTSGSTGKPKAFIRSHESWLESFKCNQVDLNMSSNEHVLIPGSFTSSTFLYGALSTLYLGGTVYILKKYAVNQLVQMIESYPITFVYVVPTMIQSLINEGYESNQPISFTSTGAKLLPSIRDSFRRNFPQAKIHEFYGASELSYVTILKDEEQEKYGESIGKPVHNAEVVICDEHGKEVSDNEIGTLYVKSEMVFDGYLHSETESKSLLEGKWASVHDIAKKDAAGFVYILGRKNSLILYGGMSVYPLEIEQTIKSMSGVEEVSVFGVQDDYWGEKVVACVKGDITIRELKMHCLHSLAGYKIPRLWIKVQSFPYTSSGKIAVQELRSLVKGGSYEKGSNRQSEKNSHR